MLHEREMRDSRGCGSRTSASLPRQDGVWRWKLAFPGAASRLEAACTKARVSRIEAESALAVLTGLRMFDRVRAGSTPDARSGRVSGSQIQSPEGPQQHRPKQGCVEHKHSVAS